MKRAIPILTAFLLFLAFAVCGAFVGRSASAADDAASADGKLDLKLHFTEGQQLVLTTKTEQTTTRTWNNQKRESKETASMTMGLKVLSIGDDGTATIEATVAAVALKGDMGRRPYEYDSANPPNEVPRAAAPYAAVVGKTFTVKLTPAGRVAALEGVDALTKAAMDTIPDEARQRGWGRGQVTRHLSEDAFKMMIEAAFGFLPDKPVAVGDSWTRTIDVDRGVPVQSKETYTLTERKDGTATITLEAKLGPREEEEGEDGGEAGAGPRVTYDVTGTLKGTVNADEATGCLFKTVIAQELKGDTVMTGFRGDNAERTVPIESKATITIECKEPPQGDGAATD